MSETNTLRNLRNRPYPAVMALVCALAGLLAGGAALEAAEVTPQRLEETPGVSGELRGEYSNRTLNVVVEIDRDGARVLSFTVKERPFVRPVDLPAPRTIEQDRDPQIEMVLQGPAGLRYTQRVPVRGICLLHPPGAAPHVAGDTIRLHRETMLIETPELAGFDRVEVAYHEGDPYAPMRRSLGAQPLDAARFTPAGGKSRYADLAIATTGSKDVGSAAAEATSGAVHWPVEYGDSDIYRVAGDESEVARRINVTVVPDGYTYAEKSTMDLHFDQMVAAFRAKTPYKEHDPFMNYILIYAYSTEGGPEGGTDQCDCDIVVDTAMATRFRETNPTCGHSDNRCLYYGSGCDTSSFANLAVAEARAPASDARLVMVNTTRYGGCGGYRAVYSAANSAALEVAIHELGHSLGGLADEYSYNAACGSSAGEVNTSMNGTTGAWPEWIGEIGSPVEGGQYYQQCIYRPEGSCEMRSLNQPFCKVCRQHWSLITFGHPNVNPTAPLESFSPASPADAYTDEPKEFSVTTRLATGATNEFNWTIDGPGYAGPTPVGTNSPTYEHTFTQPGAFTLSCEIIADTNFIKPAKYGANVDTVLWGVSVTDSAVDHDGDTYAPADGDCDDDNIVIYPTAPQLCDGINNDCDDPGWPAVPATEIDDDLDGYAECQGDCADADPLRHPGLPEVGCDGIDNDCDGGTPDALDADADTHACDVDCDDGDGSTYPGAPEVNDGGDNQCSADLGFGFADEIGPTIGFGNPLDLTELCWPAQTGATDYEVVRSESADQPGSCTLSATTAGCWNDTETPSPGGVFHYLVRAFRPHQGSLGWDSGGTERADVCGAETTCDDSLDNDGDTFIDCDDPDCLGIGTCTSVTFHYVDTIGDDIASTDLQTFFGQLGAQPADHILMTLDAEGTTLDWCSARADFYQDQYLALAPTSGSADSGAWDKWSRIGAGAWSGPDTSAGTNWYGASCSSPFAWCTEIAPSGFGLVVAPDLTALCEVEVTPGACSDGTWEMTIRVGVDRLATCGF